MRQATERARILLIEDNRDIREVLSDLIPVLGHEVEAVPGGRMALELLRSGRRFDLILLDLHMPEMSGVEFRRAQLQDASLAAIPVVVMSGDSRLDRREPELEGTEFLRKPVELPALKKVLARYESAV